MSLLHVLVCLLFAADPTPSWPAFLGSGATPLDPQTIPTEWAPGEHIAWTKPIAGYGQSSPVIWGDKIYVTTIEGAQKEKLHILCVSLQDGSILWDHAVDSTFPQKSSVYISRAAPTPVVDEQGIYAYFESGDVVALAHDGKPRWTRSLTKDYGQPKNEFGLSASPVQTADRIMILIDDDGPSYVVALSKASGDVLWKTDRSSRRSWTSPSLITFGDSVQLVASSAGSVAGYDPATGKLLWEYADVGGNTGTTPTAAGNAAFLVAASPGRDGDRSELAKKSNGLMQVEFLDGKWTPKFAWTNPAPTPSWGSPIVHQGYAYWVNRVGVVYCLDLGTGETVYSERVKQGCWATPVGIGDRIYIFGKDGLTTVIAAGKEFKVLQENTLWSAENPPANNNPPEDTSTPERQQAGGMFGRPTLYGAAIVNGSIVVRTGSQLFCIRK